MSISFLGMIFLVVIAIAAVGLLITILELTSIFLTGIGGVATLLVLIVAGVIYFNAAAVKGPAHPARQAPRFEHGPVKEMPPPLADPPAIVTSPPALMLERDVPAVAEDHASGIHPPSPMKPEPLLPTPLPRIGEETPLGIRVVTRNSSGIIVSGGNVREIPEWVLNHSGSELIQKNTGATVLKSQRFSSLEEARQQNLSQLLMRLRRELRGELPLFLHKGLTVKDLEQSGIIRQECEILWPLRIGEFEETVHELYWQIDLNSKSKDQLLAACRPIVVKARLIRLTGVVILASLIFGAAALYFRPARPA